jgi:hypothetical protein
MADLWVKSAELRKFVAECERASFVGRVTIMPMQLDSPVTGNQQRAASARKRLRWRTTHQTNLSSLRSYAGKKEMNSEEKEILVAMSITFVP